MISEEGNSVSPTKTSESGSRWQRCRSCGSALVEAGYELPLCSTCRTSLSRSPVPIGVKLVFAVALTLCGIAFARFPASVNAAVALERGARLEAKRQHFGAAVQYEKAVQQFPRATEATARLAICYFKAGLHQQSVELMVRLEGEELPEDTIAELDAILEELARIYQ